LHRRLDNAAEFTIRLLLLLLLHVAIIVDALCSDKRLQVLPAMTDNAIIMIILLA